MAGSGAPAHGPERDLFRAIHFVSDPATQPNMCYPCPRTKHGSLTYGVILVPSTSRKLRIQAGWAGQAGAVMRLPSTWELSKPELAST